MTRPLPAGQAPCYQCNGSGNYQYGGAVVNGVYTGKTGICYPCQGKGYQDAADRRRCWAYNRFYRRVTI